jgi:hypothetical protein
MKNKANFKKGKKRKLLTYTVIGRDGQWRRMDCAGASRLEFGR